MTTRTAAALFPLSDEPMALPTPRGPVSAAVVAVVTGPIGAPPIVTSLDAQVDRAVINSRSILTDDDLQLALLFLHALGTTGVMGVDSRWADDAILRIVQETTESALEEELSARLSRTAPASLDGPERLEEFLREQAEIAELDEFLAVAAVCGQGVEASHLRTALERAGLERASGHYVDAVDVRVLTARTTATMLARGESRRARRAAQTGELPLSACIAAGAARFDGDVSRGDAAVEGAASATEAGDATGVGDTTGSGDTPTAAGSRRMSGARRFAQDARLLTEHLAAVHALEAWTSTRSALRPCDVIEEDRVLSEAALALRDVTVDEVDVEAENYESVR
jgi:hypothetical protein